MMGIRRASWIAQVHRDASCRTKMSVWCRFRDGIAGFSVNVLMWRETLGRKGLCGGEAVRPVRWSCPDQQEPRNVRKNRMEEGGLVIGWNP